MKRLSVVLMSMSLWLAADAWALGPVDVDVQLGTWKKDVSGQVQSSGDDLDVEGDLELDEDTAFYARGRFHVIALGNLYASYTPMEHAGRNTLSRTVTFGDETFTAGSAISSEIEFDMYDVAWTATPLSLAVAELELGLNIKYLDGSVTVSDGTQSDSADLSVPVPMLKAVLRFNLPLVSAELEGAGIAYGGNHFYDLSAQARVTVFPFLYVTGGYRLLDVELEDGDDRADIKIGGPFLGLGVDL